MVFMGGRNSGSCLRSVVLGPAEDKGLGRTAAMLLRPLPLLDSNTGSEMLRNSSEDIVTSTRGPIR
jgi:hypothetical protein